MINNIKIENLFGEDDINLKFEGGNRIFIGDNGSGKTTLINLLYFSLTASLENLNKIDFKEIIVDFTYTEDKNHIQKINIKKNNYLIMQIETPKKFYKVAYRNTKFEQQWGIFDCEAERQLSFSDIREEINESKKIIWDYDSLDELLEDYEELNQELEKVKNSLLYFPTYRKIDDDLQNLIENDFEVRASRVINMNRIYERIGNFYNDRKVVGISEKNLSLLYSNYSDELKKMSAEGINKLLKDFVNKTIEITYYDDKKLNISLGKSEKKSHALYELGKKLGLNLDIKKIDSFYKERELKNKELIKYIEAEKSNKKNRTKIKNNKEKEANGVLQLFMEATFNNDIIINELLELYKVYSDKLESELSSYYFLRDAFKKFFKNTLDIELDETTYNIFLSKSFSNLSTGQKQLISILSYIALAIKNSSYPPLVIIDEPEISLHIGWQKKLLPELIKHENIQFIIATHSPFFVGNHNPDEILQIGDLDED